MTSRTHAPAPSRPAHARRAARWALLGAIALAGCSGGGSSSPKQEPPKDAVLQSITVSAATSTITSGEQVQLVATGRWSDGSTAPVTGATWASSDLAVATVDASGVATAVAVAQDVGDAPVSATVTATVGGVSGTVTLKVNALALQWLSLDPWSALVRPGATRQLAVWAEFENGAQAKLATGVTWSSSDEKVATVSADGLVRGVALGEADLSAYHAGADTVAVGTVYVSDATLESVSLGEYADLTLPQGMELAYGAYGVYTDGTVVPLENPTWETGDAAVATVDADGVVATVGAGTTTITATDAASGLSATGTLAVRPVTTLAFGTGDLPYDGAVDTSSAYFRITGLTPGARYRVGVSGLQDDVSVGAYHRLDDFWGECWASGGGDPTAGCSAPANGDGELFVVVDGWATAAGSPFVLDVTDGARLDASIAYGAEPYLGEVDPAGGQYELTGLEPGVEYVVTVTDLSDDVDLEVFADPWFETSACGSWRWDTKAEYCSAVADADGRLYVFVDGTYMAGPTATFRVDVDPMITVGVNSATGVLGLEGTVDTGHAWYRITGLTPGEHVTVSLRLLSDNLDLYLFDDRELWSYVGGAYGVLEHPESVTAVVPDTGELHVWIYGASSAAGSGYLLRADPASTALDGTLPAAQVLPYSGAISTETQRYRITGLDANAPYTVSLSGMTDDADLYVYGDAWFTGTELECSATTTGSSDETCDVTSNASGELYVLLDGWYSAAPTDFLLDVQ